MYFVVYGGLAFGWKKKVNMFKRKENKCLTTKNNNHGRATASTNTYPYESNAFAFISLTIGPQHVCEDLTKTHSKIRNRVITLVLN